MIDAVNILVRSAVCDVVESAAAAFRRVHLTVVMDSLDINSTVLTVYLLGMYQKKMACLLGSN